jgi:hypothetical protein
VIQGMLGIDKRGNPPCFLRIGHGVKGQGRLSRRLGAIDLDDPPL